MPPSFSHLGNLVGFQRPRGHCSSAQRPTAHAAARRDQRGQVVRRPFPAGYCHSPTTEFAKTNRGRISTSGPSSLSMTPNRTILPVKSNFSPRSPPPNRRPFSPGRRCPTPGLRKGPPTFWHQRNLVGPFRRVICHPPSAIRHLSSAISPSPFPIPNSAFRIFYRKGPPTFWHPGNVVGPFRAAFAIRHPAFVICHFSFPIPRSAFRIF